MAAAVLSSPVGISPTSLPDWYVLQHEQLQFVAASAEIAAMPDPTPVKALLAASLFLVTLGLGVWTELTLTYETLSGVAAFSAAAVVGWLHA